jgi:ATP-binding cassette subfamily F protein 3
MSSALGPAAGETKVRAQLGRFGFSRDRADLKVGVLSGGEKTRLLLSLATRNAPHLLLLDEPTNHLDMDARASLVDAVNDFEGAVVLVSHDTHLVKMVADQLWVVADGKVTPFDGDIDDYQAKLLRERNGGKGGKAAKRERAREREREREREEAPAPIPAAKDQRKQSADTRAKRAPLKKTLEALEKNIARLNKQRGDLEARLADPGSYSDPAINVAELQRDKVRLEREIAHAEHEWLVAQEAYEAA